MEKDQRPPRMSLKVYLKVLDEKTDQLFGYMVDITPEGFLLTKEAPTESDNTFQLKLELPSEIEGRKNFQFSAISMWSEKDSESDFYNTGFKFEGTSDEDEKMIEQVTEKFCFKSG